MKIAIVSEDGKTISQHFGRAPYYVIFTVENGQITGREQRDKYAHQHGPAEPHHDDGHQGPDAENAHGRMLSPLDGCQVVLSRGMGYGAYNSLHQAGIQAIITDFADIEAAVQAYLAGTLVDHSERLH